MGKGTLAPSILRLPPSVSSTITGTARTLVNATVSLRSFRTSKPKCILSDPLLCVVNAGAWCIVSAPLILGVGFDDPALVDQIIPIITNKHAIAVSQSWAGHPGMLLSSVDPEASTPDAAGYIKQTGALLSTNVQLHVANVTVKQAEAWCTASDECAAFTFECNTTTGINNACTAAEETQIKQTFFQSGGGHNYDREWATFVKASDVGAGHYAQQIWGKPLPGGSWAVLAINGVSSTTLRLL